MVCVCVCVYLYVYVVSPCMYDDHDVSHGVCERHGVCL